MACALKIDTTILALRSLSEDPNLLGHACAQLLQAVRELVNKHLDHNHDHRSKAPACLVATEDFTREIDAHIFEWRVQDKCTEAFPDDLLIDRKARRPRRKILKKYIRDLEAALKECLVSGLGTVLGGYSAVENAGFNKGVDKVLSGIQWRDYPDRNVVMEAGRCDWKDWLRKRCEVVGNDLELEGRI
ncbi:hypothetical protein BU24DRAFT_359826 [Aaosphaeria arxii CBS 175.79]|uniref:Uncharacterized protein n=1 Tax=Aaosphaeria arxii CBS 175.79 TaxID=1450172 RepID=A0A6A5X709_9PLEO|nr:uncharacterized protein BU24DRAFT_359826 [Aaosphaeria arxii CBS 175.79]KAF2008666.1 hypothetical protein BU24DRAFT_359826 [Aaosphaeria arxii CBS 175.79]